MLVLALMGLPLNAYRRMGMVVMLLGTHGTAGGTGTGGRTPGDRELHR
jgi:hypothetical protein